MYLIFLCCIFGRGEQFDVILDVEKELQDVGIRLESFFQPRILAVLPGRTAHLLEFVERNALSTTSDHDQLR